MGEGTALISGKGRTRRFEEVRLSEIHPTTDHIPNSVNAVPGGFVSCKRFTTRADHLQDPMRASNINLTSIMTARPPTSPDPRADAKKQKTGADVKSLLICFVQRPEELTRCLSLQRRCA